MGLIKSKPIPRGQQLGNIHVGIDGIVNISQNKLDAIRLERKKKLEEFLNGRGEFGNCACFLQTTNVGNGKNVYQDYVHNTLLKMKEQFPSANLDVVANNLEGKGSCIYPPCYLTKMKDSGYNPDKDTCGDSVICIQNQSIVLGDNAKISAGGDIITTAHADCNISLGSNCIFTDPVPIGVCKNINDNGQGTITMRSSVDPTSSSPDCVPLEEERECKCLYTLQSEGECGAEQSGKYKQTFVISSDSHPTCPSEKVNFINCDCKYSSEAGLCVDGQKIIKHNIVAGTNCPELPNTVESCVSEFEDDEEITPDVPIVPVSPDVPVIKDDNQKTKSLIIIGLILLFIIIAIMAIIFLFSS